MYVTINREKIIIIFPVIACRILFPVYGSLNTTVDTEMLHLQGGRTRWLCHHRHPRPRRLYSAGCSLQGLHPGWCAAALG